MNTQEESVQILTKSEQKKVKDVVAEFLRAVTIEGDFDLSFGEDGIDVVLQTQESGMVIGYHGEILESLQLLLSLACAKRIGRYVRILVEVDGYRKNRTDWLETIASQAKERALLEKREIAIPNLKSWERRVVHLFLKDDQEVLSESMGEGRERTLVVKPKTP